MKVLTQWAWGKKIIPDEERKAKRNLARVTSIHCLNKKIDPQSLRQHDTVLVTGDGLNMPAEVREFESWGIPHDIYCTNRSVMYFERPIQHWGAVDAEESAWLSQYAKKDTGRFLRHVIGVCRVGYDIYWTPRNHIETEFGRRMWVGNSGYFGILCCVEMGYQKIILAGMPLDRNRHWYDPPGLEGPFWVPDTYTMWMDYKQEIEAAVRIRSMSGYSAFIMGKADKEWALGRDNDGS